MKILHLATSPFDDSARFTYERECFRTAQPTWRTALGWRRTWTMTAAEVHAGHEWLKQS